MKWANVCFPFNFVLVLYTKAIIKFTTAHVRFVIRHNFRWQMRLLLVVFFQAKNCESIHHCCDMHTSILYSKLFVYRCKYVWIRYSFIFGAVAQSNGFFFSMSMIFVSIEMENHLWKYQHHKMDGFDKYTCIHKAIHAEWWYSCV